jgi:tetratricopeptide (TPR) repeat protein
LARYYEKGQSQQKNIDNIINLAYNLKNEDYYKKAVNVLEQGVKNYPDSVKLWFVLSRTYFEMRKFKDTLKCWEKIVQLDKKIPVNNLLLPSEKIDTYLEEVEGMIGIFNNNPVVYQYAGLVYLNNTENYKQAIYLLEQSLNLNNKQKDVYLALAEAYIRNKQKEKAVEVYEKLLKIYDDIEANYQLGLYYLYDKSDLQKAKVYLTKVKNVNPKYKDIDKIYLYLSKY